MHLHAVLEGGPCDGGALVLTAPDYPDLLTGQGVRPEEYWSSAARPPEGWLAEHVYRLVNVTQPAGHELAHYEYVRPDREASTS